ncbi:hypothetical protein [Nocardia sp. NPDC059228]|uniref:hypothetical protein n=1 Tax=Nocardia sp. NPDC059228 TaxID=3346777 RepID=UPI003675DD14
MRRLDVAESRLSQDGLPTAGAGRAPEITACASAHVPYVADAGLRVRGIAPPGVQSAAGSGC